MTNKYIEQMRPAAEKNGCFDLPTHTTSSLVKPLLELLSHLNAVQRLGLETGVLKPAYVSTITQLARNAQKRISQLEATGA